MSKLFLAYPDASTARVAILLSLVIWESGGFKYLEYCKLWPFGCWRISKQAWFIGSSWSVVWGICTLGDLIASCYATVLLGSLAWYVLFTSFGSWDLHRSLLTALVGGCYYWLYFLVLAYPRKTSRTWRGCLICSGLSVFVNGKFWTQFFSMANHAMWL